MPHRTKIAKRVHAWNTKLTEIQREYLLSRYGSFEKALKVYGKALDTGMIDFEILDES